MTDPLRTRDLDVVAVGEAIVALTADESLLDATSFAREQRGDALLTVVQAARLGAATVFVTRVGDDVFGDWLLESWEREGVHLDFAQRCAGHNALLLSSRVDGAHRAIVYRDGSVGVGLDAGDLDPVPWGWTQLAFATGSTQALGPGPEAAVAHALASARAAGARAVYDPALRAGLWPSDAAAARAFEATLPDVDLLVISAPYATGKLLGRAAADEAAREATRRGVGQTIVREPGGDLVVADRGAIRRVAVDTHEAAAGGDDDPTWARASFDGALLAALARGRGLVDAARFARTAAERTLATDARGFARLPGLELW